MFSHFLPDTSLYVILSLSRPSFCFPFPFLSLGVMTALLVGLSRKRMSPPQLLPSPSCAEENSEEKAILSSSPLLPPLSSGDPYALSIDHASLSIVSRISKAIGITSWLNSASVSWRNSPTLAMLVYRHPRVLLTFS